MLRYYYKTIRDEEFQLIPEAKEGCWIHIEEAQPEDLVALSQLLGLEQSDLQDCLDKFEVPRVEKVQSTVLIFTRHPTEYETGLYTSTLAIILAPHYIATVSPHQSHLVQNFLGQKNKLSTLQKSKFLISPTF